MNNRNSEKTNTKKTTHMMRSVITLLVFLSLQLLIAVPAWADKTDDTIPAAVMEAAEGTVRVKAVCKADGKVLDQRIRTGFMLGVKGNEPYAVTAADELIYTDAEKKRLKKEHKIEDNNNPETILSVIFQGDIEITATVAARSEQENIAILQFGQSLTDKYTLKFPLKDDETGLDEYVLSFPSDVDSSTGLYAKATAQIDKGTYLDTAKEQILGTQYYSIDVAADTGSYGAPVINEKGYLTGMYLMDADGNGLVLKAAEIQEFLDLNKRTYQMQAKPKSILKWNIIAGIICLVIASILLRKFLAYQKAVKKERGEAVPSGKKAGPDEKRARLLRLKTREPIYLDEDPFIIGSSSDGTAYCIRENRKVSRHHARIYRQGSVWNIEDQGSTNGTRVNGRDLQARTACPLKDGDDIKLADEAFVFRDR